MAPHRGSTPSDSAVAPANWTAAGRWAIVVVATAFSTCALELVATASGALLAASPLLDGASHATVLGFLAATYLLWFVGLRANLIANGRLLEETGTSTNLLSKVMFEIARRRSSSERVRQAAGRIGYLATELAKEAPYYLGAFGAAVLSDSVDATDALVFLAGTNIGAALYEFGVARLSHRWLDRRSAIVVVSQEQPATRTGAVRP
jgi:hypothetical protein